MNEVEIPTGDYGGKYKLKKDGLYRWDDDIKKFVFISKVVFIKERKQEIGSKEITLVLCYKYIGDEIDEIEISRGDLEQRKIQSLRSKGVDVTSRNSKLIEEFLTFQEVNASYKMLYKNLGWIEGQTLDTFALENFITKNGIDSKSEYAGNLMLKPIGSRSTYLDLIKDEVVGHTPLEFIFAMAFAGVLISYDCLNQTKQLLMAHAFGNSTTGKTTAAKLLASVFGKPTVTGDGLIRTWNATATALKTQFGENHGVPMILDEASVQNSTYDFSSTIYQFSQGMDKARSNVELSIQKQITWSGTFFSTAENGLLEQSNQNKGLKARVLEFESVEWTKSKEHADKLNDLLEKNFGWLGIEFVEFFFEKIENSDFKSSLKTHQQSFVSNNTDNNVNAITERLLEKYAYVLVAAEYVNECFGLTLDVQAIKDFILENDAKQAPQREVAQTALECIQSKIVEHSNFFIEELGTPHISCTDEKANTTSTYGKKYHNGEVAILKEVVDKWLTAAKFNHPKQIMKELKDRGILDAEKGRNTRKRKLNGQEVNVYVFKNLSD